MTRDYHQEIDAWLDGELSAEAAAQLETWLRADSSRMRAFVEMGMLHRELREAVRVQSLRLFEDDAPLDASSRSIPTGGLFGGVQGGPLGYFSSGWPVAYLVATVVSAVGLAIGAFTYVSQPAHIVENRLPGTENSALPKRDVEYVARITAMVDCVVNNDECRMLNAELHLGDRIALKSGLIELTYDTGAKVILQGPVTYEVESAASGYLSIGKLTARLEKSEARGQRSEPANQKSEIRNHNSFAVRTPTAVVTDLGTEFGVDVDAQGATHAQVFVGTVRVERSGGQDDSGRSARTLTAGQSVEIGRYRTISPSAANEESETNARRFTRTMPATPDDGDAYATLVLSMNPVVYYRMDQWPQAGTKGRYVLVDSAPGGHHGVAYFDETFGKPSCRGKFGGAMSLHGAAANEYAFVDHYPKTRNGQLSVSLWIRPVTLEIWMAIFGNSLTDSRPGSRRGQEGQFGMGVGESLELVGGIQQQDGQLVRIAECGTPLPRNRWQHVALVADGAVLHLYRNGAEVGAAPYHGIACQPIYQRLNVGCRQTKKNGIHPENVFFWNGWIDEVAVFNHAISAEHIRQLYTGSEARK